MLAKNKRLIGILLLAVVLLLIPLIAMQFTNEVRWTLVDFVVASVLLFGTGLMCELVLRKLNRMKHRIIFCAVLLALLLLIWIELAVGVF